MSDKVLISPNGQAIFTNIDTDEEEGNMYDGWTPTVKPALPTKAQLVAMRDYWLARGHEGTAAAIDNAIDLIEKSTAQDLAEAQQKKIDAQLDRINGETPIEDYNCELDENLAPVMTFENGEAVERQPYHSNNG